MTAQKVASIQQEAGIPGRRANVRILAVTHCQDLFSLFAKDFSSVITSVAVHLILFCMYVCRCLPTVLLLRHDPMLGINDDSMG